MPTLRQAQETGAEPLASIRSIRRIENDSPLLSLPGRRFPNAITVVSKAKFLGSVVAKEEEEEEEALSESGWSFRIQFLPFHSVGAVRSLCKLGAFEVHASARAASPGGPVVIPGPRGGPLRRLGPADTLHPAPASPCAL